MDLKMIQLDHEGKGLVEVFKIDPKRAIDIKAEMDKMKVDHDHCTQTIQCICNTEMFTDQEKVFLIFKLGIEAGNPLNILRGFMGEDRK